METTKKVVYVDTAGLWCLEALIRPNKYRDPRSTEYLANLFDYASDPSKEVRAIVPSRERLEGPLPSFYSALLRTGLMGEETIVAPEVFDTPETLLKAQFAEFSRHARTNKEMLSAWFNLHSDPEIAPGWQGGLPNQSKWPGIQTWLLPHFENALSDSLARVSSEAKWSPWQTALTFSLIQRGHSYGLSAALRKADYFTHPARWQVLPHKGKGSQQGVFCLALGGIIIGALEKGALSRDADEISVAIAGFKEKLIAVKDQWRDINSEKLARDFLLTLTPGLVGAVPNIEFEKVVKNLAKGFLASIAFYAGGPIPAFLTWVGSELYIDVKSLVLSPQEAKLFRPYVNYPFELNLPLKTCSLDGAALVDSKCPVCALREKESGTVDFNGS